MLLLWSWSVLTMILNGVVGEKVVVLNCCLSCFVVFSLLSVGDGVGGVSGNAHLLPLLFISKHEGSSSSGGVGGVILGIDVRCGCGCCDLWCFRLQVIEDVCLIVLCLQKFFCCLFLCGYDIQVVH